MLGLLKVSVSAMLAAVVIFTAIFHLGTPVSMYVSVTVEGCNRYGRDV